MQACVPTIIKLNDSYTVFSPDSQSVAYNNVTGVTVINGCAESITSSSPQSQLNALAGTSFVVQAFSQTITPLIFATACTVTLSYVFFFVTVMSRSKRPWLQRGAALSVLISLTLVADLMYLELEDQHMSGNVYSAPRLRDVRTRTVLKVFRLISNTLLWLAQVQVLIRLFPRHRDKIVIKWTGLALIVLEVVFAVLNDFYHPSPFNPNSPNELVPAIPVLTYLFHIALGVLYIICVFFYTFTSGRWRHAYAFRNSFAAVFSICAICTPTVFFCLDIWNAQVEGWGDYVRWVGSIAASVLVWDWVDRIEERVDKDTKTGVLGREVFEDEMNDSKNSKKKDKRKLLSSNIKGSGKSRNFLKRPWVSGVKIDKDIDPSIELPTIHHPMVRSVAPSGVSVISPSASSHYAQSRSTASRGHSDVPIPKHGSSDARRDLAEEHARQTQDYESSVRARQLALLMRQEPQRHIPEHLLQPDTADFVHRGFRAGGLLAGRKGRG